MANLTKDDQKSLESLERKYQAIRDRVTLCANGYGNGAYLWGDGGIGKSYSVIRQLEKLSAPFVLHNTRLSGAGFFKTLEEHVEAVHVVEDVENIFRDKNAMNLLRSALWGQRDASGRQRRVVTWITHKEERRFDFQGQIIFTGNRPLGDIPELRALATRIPVIHLQATRPEILALMKRLSQKGHMTDKGRLTPRQCGGVLDYFLEVYPPDRVFDIRILIRAFDDRLGVKKLGNKLSSSWKELIMSQLTGTAEPPLTRGEKLRRETIIAIELADKGFDQKTLLKEWKERTGRKTLDSYYRRIKATK